MKITRRAFSRLLCLAAPLFLLAGAAPNHSKPSPGQYPAYVGTYTAKTPSKGIYVYRFDSESGSLAENGVAAETPDPSFLVVHPNGKYIYAVNEGDRKSVV